MDYPDLMEDVVPDACADYTSHSQTGNSGNRAQRDWDQIVDNSSWHQSFSRDQSSRFLEDSH